MTEGSQRPIPPEGEQQSLAARIGYGRLARLVALGVLVAVFVAFAVQNTESVDMDFLWWQFEAPRILLLAIAAVLGIAVWELGGLLWRRSRKRRAGEGG